MSVSKLAKTAAGRHYVEVTIKEAKGEAGLDEYEVRSWVDWHHHMTLSLLATFFLVYEKNRQKTPAMNVPQVRWAMGLLLELNDPTSANIDNIARRSTHQLRRNEDARRQHWISKGYWPPPRK